jgi:2-polyprenyl-3-methyl-5-hydroxy-6-metoxy-1,4-benzoquinol methylase
MLCPLCLNKKSKVLYQSYPGYLENTFYVIYNCAKCNSNFISRTEVNKNIYDLIYKNKGFEGYDRYLEYANKVKNHPNSLKMLAESEFIYEPVYQFLKKQKKSLDVLEVGCGYGYTAFGVKQMGHNVDAIDISKNSIDIATTFFGDFFKTSTIEDFKSRNKYDLIYSTEVIEHITDLDSYISSIINLLKSDGSIIFTTPNKDYNDLIYTKKENIWRTDLPPIHVFWGTIN